VEDQTGKSLKRFARGFETAGNADERGASLHPYHSPLVIFTVSSSKVLIQP
jgi:hypothetical protein